MGRTYIVLLVIALAGGATAHYSHQHMRDKYRALRQQDVLETLPTANVARALCLGYFALAADYYYLKAIQHFGDKKYHWLKTPYPLLAALLNLSVDLDPKFVLPYKMGGLALTLRNMDFSLATDLLRKGCRARPGNYTLTSLLGFNLYHFEKNYKEAADILAEAAKMPEAPDYLPGLATRVAAEGGRPEVGIRLLDEVIPTINDRHLRKEFIERRMWLLIEIDLNLLERALKAYARDHGQRPKTLPALVKGGYLSAIPSEPFGGAYALDSELRPYSTTHQERLRVYK